MYCIAIRHDLVSIVPEVKWLLSKKTIIFQGSRGGPSFFRGGGGSNFFQGGGGFNCLFPIETHITCDFTGGGGPDPLPPSGSAHILFSLYNCSAPPPLGMVSIMQSEIKYKVFITITVTEIAIFITLNMHNFILPPNKKSLGKLNSINN